MYKKKSLTTEALKESKTDEGQSGSVLSKKYFIAINRQINKVEYKRDKKTNRLPSNSRLGITCNKMI
jgi:hypothetical protein